jgi:hypothetical protein
MNSTTTLKAPEDAEPETVQKQQWGEGSTTLHLRRNLKLPPSQQGNATEGGDGDGEKGEDAGGTGGTGNARPASARTPSSRLKQRPGSAPARDHLFATSAGFLLS